MIKLGANGAMALTDNTITRGQAKHLERIVDPVGAGDAFAAGFLAGLLRGYAIESALELANQCGALAMTTPGDIESLPYWYELSAEPSGDVRR